MTLDPRTLNAVALRRIADELGVPVEQLFAGPDASTHRLAQTSACLGLWSRLGTDDQRRRALDALSAIADECRPDLT